MNSFQKTSIVVLFCTIGILSKIAWFRIQDQEIKLHDADSKLQQSNAEVKSLQDRIEQYATFGDANLEHVHAACTNFMHERTLQLVITSKISGHWVANNEPEPNQPRAPNKEWLEFTTQWELTGCLLGIRSRCAFVLICLPDGFSKNLFRWPAAREDGFGVRKGDMLAKPIAYHFEPSRATISILRQSHLFSALKPETLKDPTVMHSWHEGSSTFIVFGYSHESHVDLELVPFESEASLLSESESTPHASEFYPIIGPGDYVTLHVEDFTPTYYRNAGAYERPWRSTWSSSDLTLTTEMMLSPTKRFNTPHLHSFIFFAGKLNRHNWIPAYHVINHLKSISTDAVDLYQIMAIPDAYKGASNFQLDGLSTVGMRDGMMGAYRTALIGNSAKTSDR